MIGLQSSLDRILATLQNRPQTPTYANGAPPLSTPNSATHADTSHQSDSSATGASPDGTFYPPGPSPRPPTSQERKFAPLPGFPPPPHKYGIVPSDAPSDNESDDAPVAALQGLANAAAEASAASAVSPT
jgi:hypothetical protein